MSSVERHKTGIAGSITALVRNLGMVLGAAKAVSLFESQRQHVLDMGIGGAASIVAFLSGYHLALAVGAGFAVGVLISLNRRGYIWLGRKGKSSPWAKPRAKVYHMEEAESHG
jgi:hypothetical protein